MIYLDNAAATPIDPRVEKEICKSYKIFGNPSSVHFSGEEAKKTLEKSRRRVSQALKVKPEEIVFTSSGSESVNLAVFGTARANKKRGKHIIISNIEHLTVLNSCKRLMEEGFKVSYIKANGDGLINPKDLKKLLKKDTILISVIHANNEIGTIQPIREIGRIISNFRRKNSTSYPYFHTDSCQSAGAINVRPHDLGVDLLTLNGSKIYGPKGVGCLFARRGIPIEPIIYGGSQERGLRAGTENISLAVGFFKALEIAERGKEKNSKREEKLRDFCIREILRQIPNSRLNGHSRKRLPNNINISFKGIDGEMLVLYLNQKGIMVSTGSACTTTETSPSHVIKALEEARRMAMPSEAFGEGWGNIRATLGRDTTKEDIVKFIKVLKSSVKRMRRLKS